MDLLARALDNAVELIASEKLSGFVEDRYKGWDSGMGKKMLGRQEHLENIVTYHTK